MKRGAFIKNNNKQSTVDNMEKGGNMKKGQQPKPHLAVKVVLDPLEEDLAQKLALPSPPRRGDAIDAFGLEKLKKKRSKDGGGGKELPSLIGRAASHAEGANSRRNNRSEERKEEEGQRHLKYPQRQGRKYKATAGDSAASVSPVKPPPTSSRRRRHRGGGGAPRREALETESRIWE